MSGRSLARRALPALALGVALVGCLPPPPRPPPPALPPRTIRLAVFPTESDAFPRVADRVNELLRGAREPDVDDYFFSKVTMVVAQLAVECVDQTPACYAAVGTSVTADRLVCAKILSDKRHHRAGVRVAVLYFDVAKAAPIRVADRVFANEQRALEGVAGLVTEAIDERAGPASQPAAGAAASSPSR